MKIDKSVMLGAQPHQLEAIQRNCAFMAGMGVSKVDFKINNDTDSCYEKSDSGFWPKLKKTATFMVHVGPLNQNP